MFDMGSTLNLKIPIIKISCGGMHTAAIASSGAVYTWGCNDEFALGRDGDEELPALANLPIRCTDISTGDSHTVFYNTDSQQSFLCGLYRVRYPSQYSFPLYLQNAVSGPTYAPVKNPTQFGEDTWAKHPLKKIVSGSHHSLALTEDKKVFGWGDSECGQIGRLLKTRDKNS